MLVSNTSTESEARSHPRYPVRKPIYYFYGSKWFLTLTLNLGLGGMKVETSRNLSGDEQLDIHLDLWPNSIRPKGRVVYSQLLSERLYVSGLQFIEISEQDRISLKHYLANLSKWTEPRGGLYAGRRMDARMVLLDVTKLKQKEEEIKKQNDEIERRVLERTAQLEAAYKELEAFSYSVSHDLRTPLLAIEGFSRILFEKYSINLDVKAQHLLNIIRMNTQKMGKLIENFLAFSHLKRQQLETSDIDMGELAKAVFEELRLIDPQRPLIFNIKVLPAACGDQAMIRQVFVNLLSNALKFTRPKETAVIEIGGKVEENENIYYVKDNGIGFDMQFANKLFSVFQRLHSREAFEGTGIGLAIVQRIIHRHGGQVWAEGKLNEGATFYFTLPSIDKPEVPEKEMVRPGKKAKETPLEPEKVVDA